MAYKALVLFECIKALNRARSRLRRSFNSCVKTWPQWTTVPGRSEGHVLRSGNWNHEVNSLEGKGRLNPSYSTRFNFRYVWALVELTYFGVHFGPFFSSWSGCGSTQFLYPSPWVSLLWIHLNPTRFHYCTVISTYSSALVTCDRHKEMRISSVTVTRLASLQPSSQELDSDSAAGAGNFCLSLRSPMWLVTNQQTLLFEGPSDLWPKNWSK